MSKIKNLWSDRSNQYQYAKWLVQYAKPYVGRITVMMMFNLLYTVVGLVMVTLTKRIIDEATEGNPIITLIVCYLILTIGLQLVSVFGTLMNTMLTEKFSLEYASRSTRRLFILTGWT